MHEWKYAGICFIADKLAIIQSYAMNFPQNKALGLLVSYSGFCQNGQLVQTALFGRNWKADHVDLKGYEWPPGKGKAMSPSAHEADSRNRRSDFAQRIQEIRLILYGEHGVPTLAEELGLPSRTWQNYEAGVTMPGLVLLEFIEATGVCPRWLLTGDGPQFSPTRPVRATETTSGMSVGRCECREVNHARRPPDVGTGVARPIRKCEESGRVFDVERDNGLSRLRHVLGFGPQSSSEQKFGSGKRTS